MNPGSRNQGRFPRARRELLRLGVPLLLLGSAHLMRPWIVTPRCSAVETPEACTPESLPVLDQWGLRPVDSRLDSWSTLTQNSVGLLAFCAPLAQAVASPAAAGTRAILEWGPIAAEWLMLAEATAWNAGINEWVRVGIQRPRPLLLTSPDDDRKELREEIANYNSFYSGHTSFATLAATLLVFSAWKSRSRTSKERRRPLAILSANGAAIAGVSLAIATGVLRVAAGRHYATDVIAGAMVGAGVAWTLCRRRERKERPRPF